MCSPIELFRDVCGGMSTMNPYVCVCMCVCMCVCVYACENKRDKFHLGKIWVNSTVARTMFRRRMRIFAPRNIATIPVISNIVKWPKPRWYTRGLIPSGDLPAYTGIKIIQNTKPTTISIIHIPHFRDTIFFSVKIMWKIVPCLWYVVSPSEWERMGNWYRDQSELTKRFHFRDSSPTPWTRLALYSRTTYTRGRVTFSEKQTRENPTFLLIISFIILNDNHVIVP